MQYVCPKHPDQVLFDDSEDTQKASRGFSGMLFKDLPRKCPKCDDKGYYFRHECKPKEGS